MWMGHHSPAFTLAVYVELLPNDLPDGDVPGRGNTVAKPAFPKRAETAVSLRWRKPAWLLALRGWLESGRFF